MRVRSIVGLTAVGLVLAALALPRILSSARQEDAPAAEPGTASAPLDVQVVTVRPQAMAERLATTGTLRANEQVNIVSEIAGIVEKIDFEEGAPVRKGDLLLKINDTELQAQRDRVNFRLRLAESREKRQRELRDQGVVSEQDYDVASNELNVLRADLRVVEAQLEKTEIRAPFTGIIGLRQVSEGSLLSPQTRITTLQDLDPIKMDFTLPEKYVGRVKPGDKVSFQVKGSGRSREATIYAVEPVIDPETRSLVVRARTSNPDQALLPGAFADVTLDVGMVSDALAVPSLAVIPELGGKKVFVVENGLAQPRRVETGLRTDTEVQITSGLEAGEQVIVSAVQRLRPDLPVRPVPETARGADGSQGSAAAAQ